jgi:hypothetical protein
MSAPKYVLLTLYAIASLVRVARIGKPMAPGTPGVVVIELIITGIMATLVVLA